MDMKKLFNLFKNKKGAVTIEATIALSAFLFMFIMIYSIVTVCRFQAAVQVSINATAKEISQYSYLYSISGLHEAMGNLQEAGNTTKQDTNALVGDIADVFSGIQSIGGAEVEFGDVESMMAQWDELSEDLDETEASITKVKETITNMAKDPTKLLFGMAKMFASEGYEVAKSAAAEAISRVLTEKHLKRTEDDTANAFCQSMGVVPGTYFGKESYFNGIDFSHSTLFPYGSDEITIVANYKIRLLQLLPIKAEFHVTQRAVTRGWMQGDKSASGATAKEKLEKAVKERGDSIWNTATGSEREKLIRSMGVDALKEEGYYGVSGETVIHAYKILDGKQTFTMIRSYNPLAYCDSVETVDKAAIKKYLEEITGQLENATRNKHTIKLKKKDANGNLINDEVNCTGDATLELILVIPEDQGLDVIFEEIIAGLNTPVDIDLQPRYGKVFSEVQDAGAETTPAEGGEE